jgi:hypothetical protein
MARLVRLLAAVVPLEDPASWAWCAPLVAGTLQWPKVALEVARRFVIALACLYYWAFSGLFFLS